MQVEINQQKTFSADLLIDKLLNLNLRQILAKQAPMCQACRQRSF
jgi:hypothetical protein